jgi:hypothetical protein
MLDEIRERLIKLELLTGGNDVMMGMCVDGDETLERLDLLRNLRDSFTADAQKIKSDVA